MLNVVYDRAVGFDENQKLLVKHIRKQFRLHPNIQFINTKDYFGKWRTYNILSQHPAMKKFLPETIIYSSFLDIKKMMKKYEFIFLKSFYGSMGREVMAIEKKPNHYLLSFYHKGLQKVIVSKLAEAKNYVLPFIKNKKFIIQQGIHVVRLDGQPTDLRVHLGKGRLGTWQAISNLVRISTKNSVITNEAIGANFMNYKDFYKKADQPLPTDQKVRQAAIKIALFMEKEFGALGKIGMDLAIDQKGQIWFIEANAKPDKDPVSGIEDTEGIAPQFLSTLEYSRYLACK